MDGSGGTLTGPEDGLAAAAGGGDCSWPISGDFGAAGVVVVFFVFFDGAFATWTFFRQALRCELLAVHGTDANKAVA